MELINTFDVNRSHCLNCTKSWDSLSKWDFLQSVNEISFLFLNTIPVKHNSENLTEHITLVALLWFIAVRHTCGTGLFSWTISLTRLKCVSAFCKKMMHGHPLSWCYLWTIIALSRGFQQGVPSSLAAHSSPHRFPDRRSVAWEIGG